ncbi:GTPase IMAP family member 8-like [Phyllopteryx taeniolatus]|uniref:GTPase IMAP family member 8-like n=1 Tax=Phyllopteryx taeniolatus TaxID=161469 RepID=UPI002AD2606D|nr:GTPase IMAP family member 8-like [Phyllopteryx taeniolatus]
MAHEEEIKEMPERRLVLIGGRRDGKSYSANTILGEERFESGRTRTAQSEVRHGIVGGRNLVVVDTPGWKSSPSLSEIPERDKQQFKLYASKCPPGPHAFILVIPTDSRFSFKQRKIVQEYMKLLGFQAWRYTMVLFTYGDYLGKKTIEQHIEREGEALTWLIEKCQNRYHVLNNKDKNNSSQVTQLMEKIDEMVDDNDNRFYVLDNHTFHNIKKKQEEVAQKAEERSRRALEQREQMKMIVSEMEPIQQLRIILLGSRFVGKTSVGNTILGIKENDEGTTTLSQVLRGSVGRTDITIVDTPGWRKGFPACDTTEMIKDEVLQSMFKCLPGPHVFLLVIDADASFNTRHLDAATSHVELFGEGVWKHTMVVFTRADWLDSIEEYIEGEGKALQSLMEQCSNRYHVLDNTNEDDSTQVDELLEKIALTLAGNGRRHFQPDQKMMEALMEREKKVEHAAKLRNERKDTRVVKGSAKKLNKLRILILGEKMSGKTTAANCLLRSKVFPTNDECLAGEAQVAGRQVTVVDTPGWYSEAQCTWAQDREIVRGLSLSPEGVHAVLFVISLDFKFTKANQETLEDHIKLFGDSVWNHTMVLFTNVDTLADRPLEEYIEREHRALQWLVDKCGNKYHCLNVAETSNSRQHDQLFEKIEEMSAKNQGRLFRADTKDIHLRIDEKFQKKKIKDTVQHLIEQGFRSRERELFIDFREKFEKLHQDIKEIVPAPVALSRGFKGKVKKKSVLSDIEQVIEELNKSIFKSLPLCRNSMDFGVPTMNGSNPEMDKCLKWMSMLQISTNQDSQVTLNFSESSGYRSEFSFAQDD